LESHSLGIFSGSEIAPAAAEPDIARGCEKGEQNDGQKIDKKIAKNTPERWPKK
jgi:hypothetical protein